jgi:hypothetical protein
MYMTVFGTEFGTCDASILGTVKDGPGTMILLRGRERMLLLQLIRCRVLVEGKPWIVAASPLSLHGNYLGRVCKQFLSLHLGWTSIV